MNERKKNLKLYYYKILQFLYKVKRRLKYISISNKNILALLYKEDAYKILKKKYEKKIKDIKINDYSGIKHCEKIWICWLQGIDNAPVLVKKCLKSVQQNFKDKDIVIIDKDNYRQYVNIPEYIEKKWKKGIISNAHFSDILRLELLIKYGGIWLDATVFCTSDKMNEVLNESKLFVYKEVQLNNSDKVKSIASNWLMSSCQENNILVYTRELLYLYWNKNNIVIDYFIFHICFFIATERFKEEWQEVKTYSNINPHILQFELLDKYDEKRFNEIKEMSSFHKLNWRIKNNDNEKYTMYDYIVESI